VALQYRVQSPVGRIPEPNCGVEAATCQQPSCLTECDTPYCARVPAQDSTWLPVGCFPQANSGVPASGGQQSSILAECHTAHSAGMSVQRGQGLTIRHPPHARGPVPAAAGDQAAVAAQRDAVYRPGVARLYPKGVSTRCFPDANRPIPVAAGEKAAVCAQGHAVHRAGMTLECGQRSTRARLAANSVAWPTGRLVQILASAVAGGLIAVVGTGPAFGINAASFVTSALLISTLRVPAHAGQLGVGSKRGVGSYFGDARAGLRFARQDRFVSRLLVVQGLASLATGATGPC
jgi:hypothetical protein